MIEHVAGLLVGLVYLLFVSVTLGIIEWKDGRDRTINRPGNHIVGSNEEPKRRKKMLVIEYSQERMIHHVDQRKVGKAVHRGAGRADL